MNATATSTNLHHQSVLLTESVDALVQDTAGHYVDGTFGRGGHTKAILSRLSAAGHITAFDKDSTAIAAAASMIDSRLTVRHGSFAQLAELKPASLAGILLDLGVSSPQLDAPERGFSFQADGPLDMRMDTSAGESAAQWLAWVSLDDLTEVIREYGEERFARAIAKAIIARREQQGTIRRTLELAEVVASAVKTREPGKHPATRTFQAIRIFINAELQELEQTLKASLRVLRPGGRIVVISFHSLEDRIVKQFFNTQAKESFDRRAPFAAAAPVLLKIVARVKPSPAEIAVNPRARSAVMRVAERLA